MLFDISEIDRIVNTALEEDVGRGDITSEAVIAEDKLVSFELVAKEAGVMCGGPVVEHVFAAVMDEPQLTLVADEGQQIKKDDLLVIGKAPAKTVLLVERIALNLLQHMSGIATLTQAYVKAVKGTGARILDTRKTLPGLRAFEKYAVMVGGGHNHRIRLDDGVLIKDNHIQCCAGDIQAAVERAKRLVPALMKIEVECDNFEQVKQVVALEVDVVMLDNMTVTELKKVVAYIRQHAPAMTIEASGGVSLNNVKSIAQTGVDAISIGALTHSAKALDISLDINC